MKKGVDYPGVTVSYFCHDGKGNVLLNLRSKNCRDEQGRWDNGGGGLDLGMSVEDTLAKEIKEEYCADILEKEFLGYRDAFREHDGAKTHWLAFYFKVKVILRRSVTANRINSMIFGGSNSENFPNRFTRSFQVRTKHSKIVWLANVLSGYTIAELWRH